MCYNCPSGDPVLVVIILLLESANYEILDTEQCIQENINSRRNAKRLRSTCTQSLPIHYFYNMVCFNLFEAKAWL